MEVVVFNRGIQPWLIEVPVRDKPGENNTLISFLLNFNILPVLSHSHIQLEARQQWRLRA